MLGLTFIGPCIVIHFCSKTNQRHQCFNFFWSKTLHASAGLPVHHQELKIVHTATSICQKDTADCLLAGTSKQWAVSDICLLRYVCFLTIDVGWKDRSIHVEFTRIK